MPPTTSILPSSSAAAEDCKNRGNGHFADGALDAAAECYRQAIAIDREYAEAHNNLGVVLQKQGRFEEAIRSFEQAIALKPSLARAHLNRGNIQMAQGFLDHAEQSFKAALSRDPSLAEAHNSFGNLFQVRNDIEKARACFESAVLFDPDLSEAHFNLGGSWRKQGNAEKALSSLRRAIELKPDFAEAYNSLGMLSTERGDAENARALFEKAVALRPDYWAAHHNLGLLLYESGRTDEAGVQFHKAIALHPNFSGAHAGLGLVLRQQGDMEAAVASLQRAASLDSQDMNALSNLALVFQDRDQFEDAIACYERTLTLKPAEAWRRFNLALPLLASGRLAEGWDAYENRFAADVLKRNFDADEWTGQSLRGKTLLVWGEQGIGDQILWAGLLREVIAQADRCIVECAPKLVPLFARSFPDAQVVPATNPPHPALRNAIDYQCGCGSLGRRLRPTLESFQQPRSYLVADPVRVAFWRERLASLGPGIKVGFSWCGHLATGVRWLHYTRLHQWGPVFERRGVHFVSLQYDGRGDELAVTRQRFGVPLHVFEEVNLFDDLDESAALTLALDLVISAPTSTSFLSAALGVPTWMMSFAKPWQMLGTDGFPWFPAMRCFPRRWDRSWESVINEIGALLDSYRSEAHA